MHEEEPENSQHQHDQTEPEQERAARPRIYVASLADYNEGRLHGAWIDAAQDEKSLHRQVKEMLCQSPSPGAEEWAIHDYEGFGQLHLDEFESLETVAKIAAGILEHGAAFAAWAARVGTDSDRLDDFEDAYLGEWESGKAFAEEMLDNMAAFKDLTSELPDHLAPYVEINYDSYFNDLVFGGEIITMEKLDGGLYVFQNS